jgi:type VI secretion system protein ImpG
MRDELLSLYERELNAIRRLGAEFADKYPKIAGRLVLERDKCEDPHVERLLEAFAFLTARIRLKLEDEFPEFTEAMLGIVYPHYTAPVPSMSIVQFLPDPQRGKLTGGYTIPQGATLLSRPVGGSPCKFRTCYPTTLWPMEVTAVSLQRAPFSPALPEAAGNPAAALTLRIKTLGGLKLSDLKPDRLRFFLDGPPAVVYPLYELLFAAAGRIVLRPGEKQKNLRPFVLPAEALRPVGYGRDEGMLPYPARSFVGYRLLQEFFCFPDKFLFAEFDLRDADGKSLFGNPGNPDEKHKAAYTDTLDITVLLNRPAPDLESLLAPENFRLGCTPVVNLFRQVAEPVRVTQLTTEYQVIPDLRRPMATEVYSIDSVTGSTADRRESVEYLPFYSYRHSYDREEQKTFWYGARRPSMRKGDAGTEVHLTLVDLGFRPSHPGSEVLMVTTTCTNRDLPGKLPFTGEGSDFELEGGGPLGGVRCLRKPTPTLRPPAGRAVQWRLISHLSLNYLSITGNGVNAGPGGGGVLAQDNKDPAGRDALREILKLYDFNDSAATRRQVAGLVGLSHKAGVARAGRIPGAGFCRGVDIELEFDEENFAGSGAFLFGCVLDRFLGLYVSLNSFTRVSIRTKQREGVIKRFPPRAGELTLV